MINSMAREVTALEWRLQARLDVLDRRVEEATSPYSGGAAADEFRAMAHQEVQALGERLKRHFEARFLPLEAQAEKIRAEMVSEREALRGRFAEFSARFAATEGRLEQALREARAGGSAEARWEPVEVVKKKDKEPKLTKESSKPPIVRVPPLPIGANAPGADKGPNPPPYWAPPPGKLGRSGSAGMDSSRVGSSPPLTSVRESKEDEAPAPYWPLSPPATAATAATGSLEATSATQATLHHPLPVQEHLHRSGSMQPLPQPLQADDTSADPDPLSPPSSRPVRVISASSSDDKGSHQHSNQTNRTSVVAQVKHSLGTVSRSSAKYVFKESVWDASLFIGHSSLGRLTNVLLFVAVILNVVIQALLCTLVAVEFSVNSWTPDLVQDVGQWVLDVDPGVRERVCQLDPTLSTDTYQMGLYDTLLSFTRIRILNLETGPLLSTLVIFMWTLSVSDNIRGCCDFLVAARQLSKTILGEAFVISHEGDHFYLEGITRLRLCFALFSGVLQVTIAVILLGSGALWLTYTKSITDLMLNAVALSYIMQVDELLYNVMVPRKVKALVTNMEPLPLGNRLMPYLTAKGVPRRAIITCAMVLLFTGLTLGFFILPNAEQVRQLRDTLCQPSA